MGRKPVDLTGKRFGQLTVIRHDHANDHGSQYWRCRCDCGKEAVVEGSKLTGGKTKSCGHLRKDNQSQSTSRIDEIGNRYGELTVIEYDHSSDKGTYWRCKCSCGKEIVARGNDLRHGKTKSCGHTRAESVRKATFKDMTGQRFDGFKVVSLDHMGQGSQREAYWKCECQCGNEFVARGSSIRSGKIKHCPNCTRRKDRENQ